MTRKQTYTQYLEIPHWHELRQLKFREAGKVCQFCQTKLQIRVHHINYRNLTDCVTSDLMVLCQTHHNDLHSALKILGLQSKDCSPEKSLNHIAWIQTLSKPEIKRRKREMRRPPSEKRLRRMKQVDRELRDPRSFRNIKKRMCRMFTEFHNGSKTLSRVKAFYEQVGRYIAEIDIPVEQLESIPCGHTAVEGDPLPLKIEPPDDGVGVIPQSEITLALLESMKSARGGYKRKDLSRLGVAWPPPGGWMKELKRVAMQNEKPR